MSGTKANYNIAVVDRTLDLLDALAEASEPQGISELARTIGATKSATFRILATLEGRDYVTRDEESNRFTLGVRLVQLGQRSLQSIDIRGIARPLLEDLHCQFNETVNFGIEKQQSVVYVDMIESEHGLRLSAQLGGQDLMHSTSIGKAIMAYWPDAQLNDYLSKPLTRRTSRTLTDPDELRENLSRIRRYGFSRDRGENEEGASCFGAPVFDHHGKVVGAISVSGPDSRISGEKAEDIAVAVRAAAQDITTRLGGRTPTVGLRSEETAEIHANQIALQDK